MNLYFTNEWQPFPDHDSYGHDVETGYLMLEAEDVLGQGHDPKTERMAKMLVDHALTYGWDENLGGLYREGTTFGKPESLLKEWWVQMESTRFCSCTKNTVSRPTSISKHSRSSGN